MGRHEYKVVLADMEAVDCGAQAPGGGDAQGGAAVQERFARACAAAVAGVAERAAQAAKPHAKGRYALLAALPCYGHPTMEGQRLRGGANAQQNEARPPPHPPSCPRSPAHHSPPPSPVPSLPPSLPPAVSGWWLLAAPLLVLSPCALAPRRSLLFPAQRVGE